MASYAYRTRIPDVLTKGEQTALLKATAERRRGFRDHMLFSLALATGLREHELLALDVGNLFVNERCKRRVKLLVFKSDAKGVKQEIIIPDAVRERLDRYLAWKQKNGERIDDAAPLFVSREGGRLSGRQLRTTFARWQPRAGFERHHPFHGLRHTAGSNYYRETKNLVMTQRFMRHASVESTMVYMHVCDDEMLRAAEKMSN